MKIAILKSDRVEVREGGEIPAGARKVSPEFMALLADRNNPPEFAQIAQSFWLLELVGEQ